ncbi:hypothetical protein S101395_00743 [Bacillus sonorensis]|uniref:Permease n=1 Tax=Bacillus sonorensis TaxID=119858 RepID=A0ABN5A9E5_9BACI|nr:hypothetical protein S101395_00743 [Bacillus sonorensis]
MFKLVLSVLYLFGFVILSSWSVSFGEIIGTNDFSTLPQFMLAMLFALMIGCYVGLPLIYNKFRKSEHLLFKNKKVILISLGLGIMLSSTAYSLHDFLSSMMIAILSIIGFIIIVIGLTGFLPAYLLKPSNNKQSLAASCGQALFMLTCLSCRKTESRGTAQFQPIDLRCEEAGCISQHGPYGTEHRF